MTVEAARRVPLLPDTTPPRHCQECGSALLESVVELPQGFDIFRGTELPAEVRPRLACPRRAAKPRAAVPYAEVQGDGTVLVGAPAHDAWELDGRRWVRQ